jgi:hypothetical protein
VGAMLRVPGAALLSCACLALVLQPALGALQYGVAVPPLVRLCVQAYPPFVLTRVRVACSLRQAVQMRPCGRVREATSSRLTQVTQDWQGKLIEELTIPEGFEEPYSLSGAARLRSACKRRTAFVSGAAAAALSGALSVRAPRARVCCVHSTACYVGHSGSVSVGAAVATAPHCGGRTAQLQPAPNAPLASTRRN